MPRLEDLNFELSSTGKFDPSKNVEVLFPYLAERVKQEGVVDLQEVGVKLAEKFGGHRTEVTHALYETARLVGPQYRLLRIRFSDAIRRCYPDVEKMEGMFRRQQSFLLYKEEPALVAYIKGIAERKVVVVVQLKKQGGEEPNAS